MLVLANQVTTAAAELKVSCVLIGAMACAAHGYVRGTTDVDLATVVDPYTSLTQLKAKLLALGLHVQLNLPDGDDVLGGLLRVRRHVDDETSVDIVNFYNPLRPTKNPGATAVKSAESMTPASGMSATPLSGMRCVRLRDLIALKLYAGSRRDRADVVELLRRNSHADFDAIRTTCAEYGFAELLEQLRREA